jgi:hypothetical protein
MCESKFSNRQEYISYLKNHKVNLKKFFVNYINFIKEAFKDKVFLTVFILLTTLSFFVSTGDMDLWCPMIIFWPIVYVYIKDFKKSLKFAIAFIIALSIGIIIAITGYYISINNGNNIGYYGSMFLYVFCFVLFSYYLSFLLFKVKYCEDNPSFFSIFKDTLKVYLIFQGTHIKKYFWTMIIYFLVLALLYFVINTIKMSLSETIFNFFIVLYNFLVISSLVVIAMSIEKIRK